MNQERDGALAQQVYEDVKARILMAELGPSAVLAANQLSVELGVSRTPTHEGLKRLANEGFLSVVPRVGYVVTDLSVHHLRDLYEVRISVECLSAGLAARHWTDADSVRFTAAEAEAARLAKEFRGARGAQAHRRAIAMIDTHRRFHHMIAETSKNTRLITLVDALHDESQRFLFLLPEHRTADIVFMGDPAHQLIFEALSSGDPDKARKAMSDHLRNGLREILESLVPEEPEQL